jgi:hypothetical protein
MSVLCLQVQPFLCCNALGDDRVVPVLVAPAAPPDLRRLYSFSRMVGTSCPSIRKRPGDRDKLAPSSLRSLTVDKSMALSIRLGLPILRPTRWLVLRLSTCLRNTRVQRSLHKNLITSNVSLNLGRSRENLRTRGRLCQSRPFSRIAQTPSSTPDQPGTASTHLSTSPCPTLYPRVSSL